tara:strand:+ start:294 stop:743 length:450 start_codon:yes stop_codon:yes gene_type:complete
MQQTSIQNRNESYWKIQDRIGNKQRRVLKAIQNSNIPITAQEIANVLEIPINQVTGRLKELRELCLIEISGYKKDMDTRHLRSTYIETNEISRHINANDMIQKKERLLANLKYDMQKSEISIDSLRIIKKEYNKNLRELNNYKKIATIN